MKVSIKKVTSRSFLIALGSLTLFLSPLKSQSAGLITLTLAYLANSSCTHPDHRVDGITYIFNRFFCILGVENQNDPRFTDSLSQQGYTDAEIASIKLDIASGVISQQNRAIFLGSEDGAPNADVQP